MAGSTNAARRAGTNVASAATAIKTAGTSANAVGSNGDWPYSTLVRMRDAPTAPTSPIAVPMSTSVNP